MAREMTIFNSDVCSYDFDEMKQYVLEYELEDGEDVTINDITDEQVWNRIYNEVEWNYDAELSNLNKVLDGRIICFGTLGLWNGTPTGYKVLGYNLNEILSFNGCDDIKVTFDGHKVFSCMHHHDGSHYMQYRELREDRNVDKFLEKLYNGEVSQNDIYYYTRSLERHIKQIYGV